MDITVLGMIAAFLIAAAAGVVLIPVLRRLKFGQEIREEGPKWHKSKSGTPTMGGFIFIIAIVASIAVVNAAAPLIFPSYRPDHRVWIPVAVALCFGGIGFIDDFIKVILKRNLGLTAPQKFGLQFVVSLAFSVWIYCSGGAGTEIYLPFTAYTVNIGIFFIPFAVLVMLAAVNSVNLTDGLDGLAACVTVVVAIFFWVMSGILEDRVAALFCAVIIGGLLGFLIYNRFPAKVFMGDTGSLFLGGAVAAVAIQLGLALTLLIVGFVYVMETLSVILQVASYKLTGKRIFKMSPIHHHFEMCGWSEKKIVFVFTLAAVILCAVMFLTQGLAIAG